MTSPRTRLGPYQIVNSIGAGGMGEVFRGRDPRLGRDVAIKVLPARFSEDVDRVRRFEQEARAAAALNHPHILAIYDSGKSSGGELYIVTELLEGESLRDRLRTAPLSPRKAAEYGAQIARGLAAAHEKGIIHRDLKPENVFITRDGAAKILDFGLAKLTAAASSPAAPVSGSAMTRVITEAGMVLGSYSYMSPEQVRGEDTDARTDIFSFGALLYEMLSGTRAFSASSPAETMAAVLKDDPAPLPTNIPPSLDRIVAHCLEKAAHERYQSARDLAFQLDAVSGSATAIAPSQPTRRRGIPVAAIALTATALVALVAWRVWPHADATPAPVNIAHLTDYVGLEEAPALSTDGKYVAFTSDHTGHRQVMIRLLAGGAPLQITSDAADHMAPRWSSDSSSILYYVPPNTAEEKQGTVWQVSALGGPPRRLFASSSDVDVSHHGSRAAYFAVHGEKIELRVSDLDGANASAIAQFPGNQVFSHPRWSPDDGEIGFQRGDWPNLQIAVASLGKEEVKTITTGQISTRGFAWSPDGKGIVVSSSFGSTIFYQATLNLWEYPVNGGAPRQLTIGESSYVDPDIDASGLLVASHLESSYNIWKVPIDGSPVDNVNKATQVTFQTGLVQTPSASPDGRQIVYLADSGDHANLWVLDMTSGETRQLTYERDPKSILGVPIWSPDGKYIAYIILQTSGKDWFSKNQQWIIDPDGSNARKLTDNAAFAYWSPDSRWIYYAEWSGQGYSGLGRLSLDGKAEKVRENNEKSVAPALSPDGQTLYYVVNSTSDNGRVRSEIRVASPPEAPSRVLAVIAPTQIPVGVPMIQPITSPDGKWLALILHGQSNDEIWLLSPKDGSLHRVTDFGKRRASLARRVSWSPDSRAIYAAIGDQDADIVSMTNLVRPH